MACRRRAQAILALLRDPERLERERKDYAARRPALSGFSRDGAPVGLGLSSAASFVSQVARESRANGGVGSASGGPDGGRAGSPELRCDFVLLMRPASRAQSTLYCCWLKRWFGRLEHASSTPVYDLLGLEATASVSLAGRLVAGARRRER